MNWWKRMWHRDRLERQLDAELRFHFDRIVDDHLRAGMSPDEARRAARLEFGGVEQMKEECRDARATRWAHDLLQDVRFAARLLTKDAGFTGIAVMALALGIGVNSMFFTIVNALCLRGPLRNPAGLVHIGTRDAAGMAGGVSHADFTDLRNAVQTGPRERTSGGSLESVSAYASVPTAVGDDHVAPERVTAAYVTSDLFRTVREAPVLGRDFVAEDDRAGAPPVAIVAAALWKRRYAGDAGIVGRTVRIDGVPATVVGVMADRFRFPNDAEIWLPLASMPRLATQPRSARMLGIAGVVADDGALAGVQAELDAIAARLEQTYPSTNAGVRMTAVPINEQFTSRISDPAWLAFITAGTLVLLIACANVANLLLARAVRRAGEMTIRTSVGASRARLVRQLLVECGLLAAVGGFAGIVLSLGGMRIMGAAIPPDALPSWMSLRMDPVVLAALAAVCVAAVFLFGFVPALQTSKASVTHVVRDQRYGGFGAGARRWTTGFLTLQFALTSVLMAAVIGGLDSPFDDDDPIIDPVNVWTAWVTLPAQKYGDPAARVRFYERLVREMEGISGVSSASVASALPFRSTSQRRVEVEGRGQSSVEAASTIGTVAIGHRYFGTFGVGVLQGRDFGRDDGAEADTVIVNQRFAQLYFPNENAIGRRIRLVPQAAAPGSTPWLTVVGLSPDIPQGRNPQPTPIAYRPFMASAPATAAIVLKTSSHRSSPATMVRERLRLVDPDLPLYRTMPMERAISEAGWNARVSSGLINSISTIAMILAMIGLYGVTAHGVAARSREIGVRMALGATPRHVRWLVLRRALIQLAIGVPAGAVLTILWNRTFIVAADGGGSDLVIIAVVAILLVTVGVVACLLPARHAVRVDPLRVLRCE